MAERPDSTERAPVGSLTTAVIVHWGDPAPTMSLIGRLSTRAGIDDVVVVANDLQSRPNELVESVDWLVPPRNLGFAGGFDYGYRSSPGADYYLLLNNDVDLDDACIAECQRVLLDASIGIVAPVLINSAGLQSGVGRLKRPLFVTDVHNYPRYEPVCDARWVTGAVMFIRASCYEETGFNLSYFLRWEDTDFCYRVREKGWRVAIASRAQAWHEGGATLPAAGAIAYYYGARNRIWFSRRWGSPAEACLVWLWIAAMITPRILLADCFKRRSLNHTRSVLHALADGLMTMPRADSALLGEPRPARWLRRRN